MFYNWNLFLFLNFIVLGNLDGFFFFFIFSNLLRFGSLVFFLRFGNLGDFGMFGLFENYVKIVKKN